jgi:8-oxo-dGTP pyrophosphatase MutT (NUDIX family)
MLRPYGHRNYAFRPVFKNRSWMTLMGKKQYAALPFRIRQSGLRILLVTTRKKGRWSIPKGSPISRKKPHRTAAIEAYEEAGLIGAVQ